MHSLLFSLLTLLYPPQEATIVFGGDAMQHQYQLECAHQKDGSYDYSDCFTEVKDYVQSADYAVINLETTIGRTNFTGFPCFCSPESYMTSLQDAGFDLMLTANNHTLDRRDKGIGLTIDALNRHNIEHIGTYKNAAERAKAIPFIKDINSFKVGFLNYTYGTNGIEIQGDVAVDYINREKIKKDIAATRAAGAEILCVCIHWGEEYKLLPNSFQKSMADFLVDQGVDLIIGGHPHVIQPMEIRHNDKTDRDVLVVWSLGNFISNMKTRDTRGGAMVETTLTRDTDGTARLKSAAYRLVYTIPGTQGSSNFHLIMVDPDTDINAKAGAYAQRCRDFVSSAMTIFNRYNISVPRLTPNK